MVGGAGGVIRSIAQGVTLGFGVEPHPGFGNPGWGWIPEPRVSPWVFLHEADALLGWTRLSVRTGDSDAARRHLERARELVTSTGYGRREPEVRWLEGQVASGA